MVGVSLVAFVLVRLSGDPVVLLLPPQATAEDIAALQERLGLKEPLPLQYLQFLTQAVHGDFGESIRSREPALPLVLSRLPATAQLTAAALAISVLLAIPAGLLSALRRGTAADRFIVGLTLLGHAVPTFWLAIMLIFTFAVQLPWLPASGSGTPSHLILPAITLGLYELPSLTRVLRRGLVDVMQQDYVRTARAKGLGERIVVGRHALKNAAIPVLTVFGLQLGALLGGAVITEWVFAYPGIGLLAIQAIYGRDFPVVQAFLIVVSALIVTINFVLDIAYAYVDPRIRYE